MAEEENVEETGGGGKKKAIIIVAALLVAEAAVLSVAFMLFAGGPKVAEAGIEAPSAAELEANRIIEIEVIDDKLPNSKRGVPYIYDTRIFAQVRNRNAEMLTLELDQFRNEIKAEIAGMWRNSDPRVFGEPRLETLTRKLEAMFRERMGTSPDTGEPIVEKIVIVLGPGFRVDS